MSTDTLPPTDTAATNRPALTAKGAATRLRIIQAAAARIRARGAAGTSIDDVRADAKVSASQLYHYFSDKKELVRAVVAHEAAVAVAEQQPHLDSLDSIESLRTWRDAVVAQARDRASHGWSPLGSLASELIDTDPDARAGLVEGFGLWLTPVENGLEAMRAAGALRDDADPRSLAVGLLAALQGGLLISRLHEQTAPLESALDAAVARVESFAPRRQPGEPSRQPLAPAVRRTPASPARASGAAPAGAAPAGVATGVAPRTPMRPRRPLAR
ncbi:TetR/AcrR family transcriptional regulator [Agreia pratensis]|uniref:Transcriptional regulator, TetR family n=1 Tax=Agreia pratensis TaxID=150121 RepID=A0A1X7KSM6_9MICO|nr:TetR family transcriptional regulator [Agreia pratensis]SMG43806.1 transcriptional regulator, TetR family [Agreia pratensis]